MAATTARMEELATLPVFFKLGGKRAVLAGGGQPAVWKAELLSAAGANVTVFVPDPDAAMLTLAQHPPRGPIIINRRAWEPGDLPGAAIALGAIEDEGEAHRFQTAARQAGVPVNVIDKPAFCDFQFGTIVNRSPLVIGISTDGAAPVFGQAIRTRIEALLPQSLKAWAEAARDWRPSVQALGLGFQARRRFWEGFADRALASPDAAPSEADRAEAMAAVTVDGGSKPSAQCVILVGAGRGDPDGITLRAIKALQTADRVFHPTDGLSPILTGYARRESSRFSVPTDRSVEAETDVVTEAIADNGPSVWLDSGNPVLCRRWAARRARLLERGIAVMMVEGLGLCSECDQRCPAWPR